MKVGYKRDICHNYIEIEQEDDYFEYQVQMITRNHIKGFLDCKREQVDNKTTFLYEINSRQPVVQILEKNKLDHHTFFQLLFCLKTAVEEAEAYLLDVNSLVLKPEYIYMNPETKEMELIYLPGYWENMKDGLHELAKQLLNWIDYKNEKVVVAAYELYKQTSEENYTFEAILNNLSKESRSGQKEQIVHKEIKEKEHIEQVEFSTEFAKNEMDEEEPDYIYGMYEENEEEQSVWDKMKEPVKEAASKFFRGLLPFSKRNERIEEYPDLYGAERKQINVPVQYGQIAEESVYGNTVFLQNEKTDEIPMLVAIDNNQYQNFEILICPFIIGKLTEAVDGIVDEATVSRIHAKIDKKDGQYYLMDLNSTNGTYLNEKMLAPNEKTKLQSGDQLQFGSVSYYFKLERANNSSH